MFADLKSQTETAQFNVFEGMINSFCLRRNGQRKNPKRNREKCTIYTLNVNYNIEFNLKKLSIDY